jgi:hypothetical protein
LLKKNVRRKCGIEVSFVGESTGATRSFPARGITAAADPVPHSIPIGRKEKTK